MTTTNRQDPPPNQQPTDHSGDRPRSINPERLLNRAASAGYRQSGRFSGTRSTSAASTVVTGLLRRLTSDRLIVIDRDGTRNEFGPGQTNERSLTPLTATITITDDRAWRAVLREGSIGLGRGYIEGWWQTDSPTDLVRILIRNLHGMDQLRNRLNRTTGRLGDTARKTLPRSSRTRNREDISTHYDLGNDFFRLFLDDSMTYSSAVFADPGLNHSIGGEPEGGDTGPDRGALRRDLLAGSLAKYDRLLSKIGVRSDHELLEIGTGWGGLAIRAAEQRGASVTTTTVSAQQLEEARARLTLSEAGSRVTLLNQDWRDLGGNFDRIVSIEMIEAVDWRDYQQFFGTMERCLAPDGMIGLQAICVPDGRYERAKNTEDFIRRFVFPGGFLPSLGAIARAVGQSTRLQILDVEDFSAHYAETLRLWRVRFDERIDQVRNLGLDDRFCRLWRFYLAYCEAGFLERHCTVNQIVLVGPDWRPNGLDLRPL